METFGNVWKLMEPYGDLWKLVAMKINYNDYD